MKDLDYTKLYQAYSAKGRNPAVNPKKLKPPANGTWLLAGQKAPDHSIIARFRSGFLEEICKDLFYQMVHRLERAGELSKETVFLDGTKLEACANKYTFVWKKSVGKWEEKSGSEVTVYECEDCTGCPYKEKCTKAKGNKRLYVSKCFLEKREESYQNIQSEGTAQSSILMIMRHPLSHDYFYIFPVRPALRSRASINRSFSPRLSRLIAYSLRIASSLVSKASQ